MIVSAFEIRNFNCTIQELKPSGNGGDFGSIDVFQLHHTGIKTGPKYLYSASVL